MKYENMCILQFFKKIAGIQQKKDESIIITFQLIIKETRKTFANFNKTEKPLR